MKYVGIGLQCTPTSAFDQAGVREYAYPFDWMFCPGKTSYIIMKICLEEGIENAIEYMITGYKYYILRRKERYTLMEKPTNRQMNPVTGVGIVHNAVNDDFKATLKRRFERLLIDIRSGVNMTFVYADTASYAIQYHLDGIDFGVDVTEYLIKLHVLLSAYNPNIKIKYFCHSERMCGKDNNVIEHIGFTSRKRWEIVAGVIAEHIKLNHLIV